MMMVRSSEREQALLLALGAGIEVADHVLACWSQGDLAGAVRALENWRHMTVQLHPGAAP